MIKEAINKVVDKENLSVDEAKGVMNQIIEGKASTAQIGGFITALKMKGETSEEIFGFAQVMRDKAVKINSSHKYLLDTCGTGGDGVGTFNISTTTAIIAAAGGVSVAKHGNRSVSSKSGSADVLEALGVNIDLMPVQIEEVINRVGLGFLFAPTFHSSMKHAIGPRREIGIRSIFNILGPLTNPARAKYQVLGVYKENLTEILAEVLKYLGVERALVVHGAGGLDEISILGPSKITQLNNGIIHTFTIDPKDYGFPIGRIEDIRGGDPGYNAKITLNILSGEKGARRDIVLLNSAAAFIAAGLVEDFTSGIKKSTEIIDSGLGLQKLNELRKATNSF